MSEPTAAARRQPGMVGLDYRTAPVTLRERLRLARAEEIQAFLRELPWPAVVLATCHRIEVYVHPPAPVTQALAELERRLAERGGLSVAAVAAHAVRRSGEAAVRHLVEVACGLHSAVLGEPQILGQVRDALQLARQAGTVDAVLHRLFERAVHAGKEVRTRTQLGRGSPSLARAAVRCLQRAGLGPQEELLVVGSGEMAMLAVREAWSAGLRRITLCARRPGAALEAARAVLSLDRDGRPVEEGTWLRAQPITELAELLLRCGGVISATTAPGPVILASMLQQVVERRGRGRPLWVVDLAVPRDVEVPEPPPEGLRVWSVDDLAAEGAVVQLAGPGDVEQAYAIAAREAAAFVEWYRQRQVVDTLRSLTERAEQIRDEELAWALRRLAGQLDEQGQKVLARMAHRLTSKLLHLPMLYLKALGAQDELPGPQPGQAPPDDETAGAAVPALSDGDCGAAATPSQQHPCPQGTAEAAWGRLAV